MRTRRFTLPLLLLMTLVLYLLLHDLFGGTLLASSPYNSYTLQALAWQKGQLGLGQDYPWLELAIYGGDWFVSFPPVPSVVMLPFTLVFGAETPDNLIILYFALAILIAVYCAVRSAGASELTAGFYSAFFLLGSNLLWMCSDGSVWFLAQSLNMVFCTLAILFAVRDKRVLSFAMVALAVGCRPFSILLFVPLLVFFIEEDMREKSLPFWKALLSQWKLLLLPALIGGCYMWYNYARFHNPFEFGHTYLPEFNRGEPQFSAAFLWRNLKKIFRPVTLDANFALKYPVHDGFLFFAANPFFLLLLTRLKKLRPYQWTALICMVLNLVLLLTHRTFGGWQFGARYTVDLLSYALLICLPRMKERPPVWELWIGAFAILFNLYGALAMHFLYK